jgi:hypothetical protein
VLREDIGAPLSPAEADKLDQGLQPARQALDAEAEAAIWAEGRATPLDQIIKVALSG